MRNTHDNEVSEVMTDICDFYYPGARFVAFPGSVEIREDGSIELTPGVLVDRRAQ